MRLFKLKDYIGGWFIGDFEPAIVSKKDFEIGVKYYKKGDGDISHFHKVATEITIIVYGAFLINEKEYRTGDVIQFDPGEISNFRCLEDGATAIVKTPSVKDDKYVVLKP